MTLTVRRWGSGPRPALFVHGFTGSERSFDHLEPLLGDELTASCVELPGHHQAAAPRGTFDDVIDAIAAAASARSIVIGYSQGARLALGLAIKHPSLVERLVLESGTPGLHRRHDRALRRRSDAALAEQVRSDGVEAFLERWENLPLFAGLRALPASVQAQLRQRRASHQAEGLAAALEVMGQGAQPDYWPLLQHVRAPTLLISGRDDVKYSRLARAMAAELPLAWSVSFRGVGHAPHLEAPEAWAAEVRSFLNSEWTHEPRAGEEAR